MKGKKKRSEEARKGEREKKKGNMMEGEKERSENR